MSGPYNVKQALLAAYRHLLTPLVRILLRNGISYLEFAEVTREVFVNVAGRDFTLPKRKISLSRIAIMTGLSRKEAASIRNGTSVCSLNEPVQAAWASVGTRGVDWGVVGLKTLGSKRAAANNGDQSGNRA